MDVATILISTSLDATPENLRFFINGQLVNLCIIENNTKVMLANDEEEADVDDMESQD